MQIKQAVDSAICVWEALQNAKKPIMLYGMGDGAQKILAACARYGIKISEVFASDGFVRSQEFCGYIVRPFSYIEQNYNDFIILLGFGSSRQDVLSRFYELNARYELYAPDVPLAQESENELFTLDYAREHIDELQEAYLLFCDDKSREVFESVVKFKISGKIDLLKHCESPREEIQNIIRPRGDDFYIDLGAYNGDTVIEFLSRAKNAKKIVAVEPDRKNFKKLCRNLNALQPLPDVFAVNAPVWSDEQTLYMSEDSSRGSAVGKASNKMSERCVTAVSVDGIMRGRTPQDCALFGNPNITNTAVTFIKADVEGAEERALIGACETICAFSPQLEIAAYHRNSDLFVLPRLIHKLNPEYKLYLRHHPYVPAWETNIYAMHR